MNEAPDIARLIAAWGPGLLFMGGFGWIAYKLGDKLILALGAGVGHFSERFLAAHDAQAKAIERLASAVETSVSEQRDTAVALRALALKIDELRGCIAKNAEGANG